MCVGAEYFNPPFSPFILNEGGQLGRNYDNKLPGSIG
jgi:hypothetical protein